jgi:Na+/phosphate symporter
MDSGAYDDNILSGIINRDNEIDKFYFLIVRQIAGSGGFEGIVWVQVAKSMERISDHIETIAQLLKEGKRIKKDDHLVFKELIDLYGDVMLTLKNKDLSSAEEILNRIQKIRAKGADIKNNLDGDHCKNILIYASFRRIGEYISDMAESAINLS